MGLLIAKKGIHRLAGVQAIRSPERLDLKCSQHNKRNDNYSHCNILMYQINSLYTLNLYTMLYVNYISIKINFKKKEIGSPFQDMMSLRHLSDIPGGSPSGVWSSGARSGLERD